MARQEYLEDKRWRESGTTKARVLLACGRRGAMRPLPFSARTRREAVLRRLLVKTAGRDLALENGALLEEVDPVRGCRYIVRI